MNNTPACLLPPLHCRPIYKEKIWGGRALEQALNRDLPAGVAIGESWELSGYGADVSCVEGGPQHGMTLDWILASRPDMLIGSATAGGAFPLLYKFIDANDNLSVQVHPNDEQATANGWGAFGKTECWYVTATRPGTRMIVGLDHQVTVQDIASAVENNTLENLLNSFEVHPGDVVHIPAGTIHAIMEGTLVYEVQETSDTTFRLYDWGRTDAQGRPRDLHVRESLKVINTRCSNIRPIPPLGFEYAPGVQRTFRSACRYFVMEEFTATRDCEITLPAMNRFRVITLLDGTAAITGTAGRHPGTKGETILIPACIEEPCLALTAGTHFLLSYVPNLGSDVIAPLKDKGMSSKNIALLGGPECGNDLLALL